MHRWSFKKKFWNDKGVNSQQSQWEQNAKQLTKSFPQFLLNVNSKIHHLKTDAKVKRLFSLLEALSLSRAQSTVSVTLTPQALHFLTDAEIALLQLQGRHYKVFNHLD